MIRVALLDSGFDHPAPVARQNFARQNFAGPDLASETPKPLHGSALAAIIAEAAPAAQLLDARIFGDGLVTQVSAVVQALDWAVAMGADIINLSLGLREDRAELHAAVTRAVAAGVLMVAAVPARGGPVYPGHYAKVIRATGDARCAPGDLSWIGDEAADFGASPAPMGAYPQVAGASVAATRVTGALAALAADHRDPCAALRARCRFTGRERRS